MSHVNPHSSFFPHLFYSQINTSRTLLMVFLAVYAQAQINVTHYFIVIFEIGKHANIGTNFM